MLILKKCLNIRYSGIQYSDSHRISYFKKSLLYQVVIAQWLARRLETGVVLGSNPGKEDNFLISDLKGNLIKECRDSIGNPARERTRSAFSACLILNFFC